jgi:hypothetical protein
MKKIANYHIFSVIFDELMSIYLIKGITFQEYDACNIVDVNKIASLYIEPRLRSLDQKRRDYIRWAFEYYMTTQSAPFEELRSAAQDLDYFCAPDDAQEFLRLLGLCLYGEDYLNYVNLDEYEEKPNYVLAQYAFEPTRHPYFDD